MSKHITPIDISNMPDLLDLAEEVKATNEPRELRRDDKPVAILTPISAYSEKWKKIKSVFGSWSDLDIDKVLGDISDWREKGEVYPIVKTKMSEN